MTVTTKKLAQILVVLALMLSGCASKPTDPETALKENVRVLREIVSSTIKDNERRDNLFDSIQSLEITLSDYNQAYNKFAIEFSELNRRYDTPREELEKIQASLREKRKTTLNKLLAIHFEMVAQTSEDEWKRIAEEEWQRVVQ